MVHGVYTDTDGGWEREVTRKLLTIVTNSSQTFRRRKKNREEKAKKELNWPKNTFKTVARIFRKKMYRNISVNENYACQCSTVSMLLVP